MYLFFVYTEDISAPSGEMDEKSCYFFSESVFRSRWTAGHVTIYPDYQTSFNSVSVSRLLFNTQSEVGVLISEVPVNFVE